MVRLFRFLYNVHNLVKEKGYLTQNPSAATAAAIWKEIYCSQKSDFLMKYLGGI